MESKSGIYISADAAITAERAQKAGYRGVAVLVDPDGGYIVVLRVQDDGSHPISSAPIPGNVEAEPSYTELPNMNIPTDASAEDVFRYVHETVRVALQRGTH